MVVFALTLIRHGETAHNKDNVIQGQLDIPLSQTGFHQAELLGFHLQYQQYSHVYVSDLTRAKQTAESIIRQNKSFKATLFHDRRLRERKFGNVEGKSYKFLKEAAEKSKQSAGQYIPPGGETIQQVHERAVSFFKDLCRMVRECSKLQSTNDSINDCSVNQSNLPQCANERLVGQKRKWENGETELCQKNPGENNSVSKVCIKEISKSGTPEIVNFELDSFHKSDCNDINKHNQSKVGALLNGCNCHNHKYNKSENGPFSSMFTDDVIRSQIMSSGRNTPNIECPNVSLSPLVDQNFISSPIFYNSLHDTNCDSQQERRLSVCSSCDDVDMGPTLMANILVVSHGGWLRELLRHFVEDLECSVPGGRTQALRISPNAGLSKFTVSLEDHDGRPKIICLQIHDKQHLNPTYEYKKVNSDDIAL